MLTAASKCLRGAAPLQASGDAATEETFRRFAWVSPPARFEHWIGCAQIAHRAMCRKVIVTTVEELVASSNSVMKAVPAYDHVFSAPKLNLKTAATSLVSWPTKKALGVGRIASRRP